MRRMRMPTVLAGALLVFALPAQSQQEAPVIEEGRTVSIEYTLTLDDGSTADTNVGGEPLVFEQGRQQILPALELELAGLSVDDTVEVTLPPDKGYGEVDPELFREVEPSMVPEQAREEGTQLVAEDQQGNKQLIQVREVRDESIVLDFNHPLAGETLHFAVKVVSVE